MDINKLKSELWRVKKIHPQNKKYIVYFRDIENILAKLIKT